MGWKSGRRRTKSKSRVISFDWLFVLDLLVLSYVCWFQLGPAAVRINKDSNDAEHLGNVGNSVCSTWTYGSLIIS